MKNIKKIPFMLAMVFCILFFGVFVYFFLLQNRKNDSILAENNDLNDSQNLSNDWKNVFGDLQNAFNKMN